ncbi:hypothetical protein [Actinoplanes sp. NPDC020271]|uniref:hypothetical protein n=1 Tax=Actinoplanes sp. NPDC020271 TaxID=3363896 RepID=UPI00378DF2E5
MKGRTKLPAAVAINATRPGFEGRVAESAPAVYQPALLPSAAGLTSVPLDCANELLTAWGHYLGACHRPFGAQAWALEVAGEPVGVAVSASTVSSTAAGYGRKQLVELARLCSAPTARWATRPMLRLWREVAAPAWPYWPVVAAVAYSHNGQHDGGIYRFDGWTRSSISSGSLGGGTWSRRRGPQHSARGAKTLWLWPFDHQHRDRAHPSQQRPAD